MNMHKHGIAVLDGYQHMISAIGHAMKYRDRKNKCMNYDTVDFKYSNTEIQTLNQSLKKAGSGFEYDALQLFDEIGIPIPQCFHINSLVDIERIPSSMKWPLVLKTAESHAHKTELNGVILNIETPAQLAEKYQELSDRLGQCTIVQSMAPKGQEIALGMINDSQFGPVIMLGSGGVNVELYQDQIFVLGPVNEREANSMVERLHCYPLIKGYRGAPSLDKSMLIQCILLLSKFSMKYSANVLSIDINPLIVHEDGALAVDGLVETRKVE